MKKFEKTYHVSRNHKLASYGMGMFVERLQDSGWTMTQSKVTTLHSFTTKGGQNNILGKITDLDTEVTNYLINEKAVSLNSWLNAEQKITQARCVFDGTYNLGEVKWRLAGTDNEVVFMTTNEGVFVSAYGDQGLHSLVKEFYAETKKPDILFSATVDGELWELVQEDDEE